MNANGKDIGGVVPIIPVPFDAGESVDEGALRRLVDFAVACKVDAVCLPAYGSEFYKLSEEERTRVVAVAVEQAAGRLKVVAQCNHGSSRVASSLAGSNLEAGADLVSIAIPRQFPVPDEDLLRFLAAFLDSFTAPCLLQDFNPGGPTLSAAFLARLRAECPNLAYLKLEEPLSASKVAAMVEATGGEVGILTGWGGLYMMELIPAGICGLMPGLG
ncbi:MAG: dihydrodipicolinate synthase family protein, partial [Acidobacteria bacterium]|nr:dihydrodipicolinate synthase family protein [Acidobacteriota bacterium]